MQSLHPADHLLQGALRPLQWLVCVQQRSSIRLSLREQAHHTFCVKGASEQRGRPSPLHHIKTTAMRSGTTVPGTNPGAGDGPGAITSEFITLILHCIGGEGELTRFAFFCEPLFLFIASF